MSIPVTARKKFLIIGLILIVYFVYVTIFLKPWIFHYFSLVDDGQVLIQSSSYLEDCLLRFKCSKFADQTFEFGTSRFRPSYWLINNLLYEIFRNNAEPHHLFRIYVVGAISVLLLALILIEMGIDWLFVLIGTLVFMTNYSFTENIIRLGTNEPYQVIFLAIFSLLYFKKDEMRKKLKIYFPLLVILLTWALLIKENTIAVLPAILAAEYVPDRLKVLKKSLILVGIPSLVFLLGTIVSKIIPSTISPDIPVYTSNYVTHAGTILNNSIANIGLLLNSMSPFLKLAVLSFPLLFAVRKIRKFLRDKKFYYWMFFTLFFTGVLFPWRYVLERYQLVAIFGLSILTFFLLNQGFFFIKNDLLPKKITTELYGVAFYLLTFVVVMNLFFRGFPVNLAKTINYREWFSTFVKFEGDQVRSIAKYNNQKVYINGINNINNWELLYEVPIHLRFLYSLNPNTEILEGSLPDRGYIFSRSSFDSYLKMEELEGLGYKRVDYKSYSIGQIDPIKFRKSFLLKPLQTILAPPLKESGFEYYWEVRNLEK